MITQLPEIQANWRQMLSIFIFAIADASTTCYIKV